MPKLPLFSVGKWYVRMGKSFDKSGIKLPRHYLTYKIKQLYRKVGCLNFCYSKVNKV